MGPSFRPNVGTGTGECWWLLDRLSGGSEHKGGAPVVTSGDTRAGPLKEVLKMVCFTVAGQTKLSAFGSRLLLAAGTGDWDMMIPPKTKKIDGGKSLIPF